MERGLALHGSVYERNMIKDFVSGFSGKHGLAGEGTRGAIVTLPPYRVGALSGDAVAGPRCDAGTGHPQTIRTG